MSDKVRAEIEAKRAKLAELRKARADRKKADAERRVSEVSNFSMDSNRTKLIHVHLINHSHLDLPFYAET